MAKSREDLKHHINCSCSRARSHDIASYDQEEISSTEQTYRANSGRDGMQVKIRDLERRIRDIARNMCKKLTYDLTNTEIESPFIEEITEIVVPHKFRQPQMESYDGSGSPIDYVPTYKSRMALTTNFIELYYLAFPSTLK